MAYPELFPIEYERYIEPFLGGGSLFFALNPSNAILSDVNHNLISCYQTIRRDWKSVWKLLVKAQELHSHSFYYQMREGRGTTDVERATRFLYLNRTCFNGLYRENRRGEFNVPIGTKTKVILSTDNFKATAARLRRASIRQADFEQTLAKAQGGDFVFVDPPYTVAHNQNGFIKYNNSIFSWDDQIRLKDTVLAAAERGARILVLNADHASVRKLYSGIGKARKVQRISLLAADGGFRRTTTELAIQINHK